MASPTDFSKHAFRTPVYHDPRVLEKTWALRTTHTEVSVGNDIIKKRPPFFNPDHLAIGKAQSVVETNFPGLTRRTHYNDLPLYLKGHQFPLHIYDLEGHLRIKEHLPFHLILAGMYHYAQYLREIVWIFQEEVECSQGKVLQPFRVSDQNLVSKRCWFFVVKDLDLHQYSLTWLDLKHGKLWYVDSRPIESATPTATIEAVGLKITHLAARMKYMRPVERIRRVQVTQRPARDELSGLFVIENFRMRILESPEQNKAILCESGLMDWTKAMHRQFLGQDSTNPYDDMLDRHIYTYSLELSCLPGRLRWPSEPQASFKDWKSYLNPTYPFSYKSNAGFLPDNRASLPAMSIETEQLQTGRAESLLTIGMFRMSRASTTGRTPTPVLSSRESSRAGSVPRLADQFGGLFTITQARETQNPAASGGSGRNTLSNMTETNVEVQEQIMRDIQARDSPSAQRAARMSMNRVLSQGTIPGDGAFDTRSQGQRSRQSTVDLSGYDDVMGDEGFTGLSRQSSRYPSVGRNTSSGMSSQLPSRQPSQGTEDPFNTPPVQSMERSSSQAQSQPSPVIQAQGTPSLPQADLAVQLAQPPGGPSRPPQRRPMSARHMVNYKWNLTDRSQRATRLTPVLPPLTSPHTSLWAHDSTDGYCRPTHNPAWRGFAFEKAKERRERDIEQARKRNAEAGQ